MKKTYQVKVEVKVPVLVAVEAEDRDAAMELGAERAKAILLGQLPHREGRPYQYVAVDAEELPSPETLPA